MEGVTSAVVQKSERASATAERDRFMGLRDITCSPFECRRGGRLAVSELPHERRIGGRGCARQALPRREEQACLKNLYCERAPAVFRTDGRALTNCQGILPAWL